MLEERFFRLKNPEIFNDSADLTRAKIFEKDQIIYSQGDDGELIYFLKSGKVQIYVGSAGGAEKILAVFSGGGLFGKSAFFEKMPRATSARALKKSEIVPIDKNMLAEIIKKEPQFALDMLEYLSKTIRVFSNQIENISFLQADKRVAMFLLDNAQNGRNERIERLPRHSRVQATHDEIAATIGASRVTVSKILRRFARDGLIETKYREIKIIDPAALRRESSADAR
ncbi:MAG: Crp/Fnr family transcriptional regulator [Defluviitaleaceae bacterium]|nr:Crp/Fnr family transcriptional regulator [Defluviitaleaceae bacterium]